MAKEDQSTSWDKVDIFGQNKGKVVVAGTPAAAASQEEVKTKPIPNQVEVKNVGVKEVKKEEDHVKEESNCQKAKQKNRITLSSVREGVNMVLPTSA